MTQPDELLGIPEVANLLGIPCATLRWYRASGIGPKSFKVGRRVRYWRNDCLDWLAVQEANTARGGYSGSNRRSSRNAETSADDSAYSQFRALPSAATRITVGARKHDA